MYFDSTKTIEDIYNMVTEEIERIKSAFDINSYPNLLPYDACILRNNCILVMRQYMCYNLRDRMIQKIPKIQKKWIAFQLICAVCQLHSKAMTHGDLKPENVLLTSYDWLFITDFLTVEDTFVVSSKEENDQRSVNYKPTYIEEESWNIYNMYFGDLDNNKK
jgi:serine/threonine protein kinase